jgi:hypothetical protein
MDPSNDGSTPGVPPTPADTSVARVGDMGVINKRMIVWGPDGVPRPASTPVLSPKNLEDLATTALSLPFVSDPLSLSDKEFEGMTNAEVMLVRLARAAAGGSQAATEAMLDRVLGRPKQSLESKSMTMTYADVLREKADRAAAETKRQEDVVDAVIDVVAHPPSSRPDPHDDNMEGLI